jgi:glycosyltransferase involved in cell wall biosynthesis
MKIAVYAICKNEAKHLEGFLENVKDADLVVIADTGSTDGMWGNMYETGPVLHPNLHVHNISVQPWRFDIARNAALALVPADVDVCVSLDLDERLQPGWREGIERAFKQFPDLTRLGVRYQTKGFSEFIHNSRVHTRSGFYWKDPCHEALHPWMTDDNEVISKSVLILHTPDYEKPRDRLVPLASGVAEEPWNRRRIFYYGRELILEGKTELGLHYLKQYMALWAKSGEPSWWEVEQCENYIKLGEGVLAEQTTH